VFYYNTTITTSVSIKVVLTVDALAVLYLAPQIPQTFNYLILNNVIKVLSNFTSATAITGPSITNGGSCLATCYITYSLMTSPVTLITATTPSH